VLKRPSVLKRAVLAKTRPSVVIRAALTKRRSVVNGAVLAKKNRRCPAQDGIRVRFPQSLSPDQPRISPASSAGVRLGDMRLPLLLCLALLSGCAAPHTAAGLPGQQAGARAGGTPAAIGRGPTRLDGVWLVGRLSSGLLPPGQPRLSFAAGTVTGTLGCGTLRGRYVLSGLSLSFGSLVSAPQSCSPEARAAEALILQALRGAVRYYPMTVGGQQTLRLTGGGTLYLQRP
jgi:heat shock protein HslJ